MKPALISHILGALLILVTGSIGLNSASAQSESQQKFKIAKALPFKKTEPPLTLDLYLPTVEGSKTVPCIIVIQGGGFRPQNGQRFKSFAEHLANNGFAAALISYRGSPAHKHRDTLADVRDSVRFIRSVAKDHNIDPNRIGATGRSAGGTLSALLAVKGGEEAKGAEIQAAVCFSGVFDFVGRFTNAEQLELQPKYQGKIETNGAWIGPPFAATNKEWLDASAINHVDPKDPPILFLHSRNDTTVPWIQSRDMHQALEKAGSNSRLKIYEDGGHSVQPKDAKPMDEMVAFFKEHL